MSRPLHVVRPIEPTVSAGPGEAWQAALRPRGFDDYIGQREIIENLRTSVRAARTCGWRLDHFLISGPPGLGKTSLAHVIAAELGAKLSVTSAPAITHKGELASLLTSLGEGDVLFIDEIHRLSVPLQETLYSAMEDFKIDLFTADKRAITVPLPRFTLLGATTHAGLLSAPLLDRFGFHWQLRYYELPDMEAIVSRAAALMDVAIDDAGCTEIARRSRGTPRIANRLLRRVRDYAALAAVDGALVPASPFRRAHRPAAVASINGPIATDALGRLGVDHAGLDELDRAYLRALCARRGPAGVESIAATLAAPRGTLEDVVEPFLLQIGYIARTPRGRIATESGLRHLEGGV